MTTPQEMWTMTADAFDERYDAIGDKWGAQTPCSEWEVRALVDHAVGVQAMMGGALGAEVPDGADWPAVRSALSSALDQPGVLDGNIPENPVLGTMPRQQVLGIAIGDLLIHTWDLARAIGADETLPAEVVPMVHQALQGMPQEFLRAPERFGDAIDAPSGADVQTQLLLYSGRQV